MKCQSNFRINANLYGKQNPKTLEKPLVLSRAFSSSWNDNDFVVKPQINELKRTFPTLNSIDECKFRPNSETSGHLSWSPTKPDLMQEEMSQSPVQYIVESKCKDKMKCEVKRPPIIKSLSATSSIPVKENVLPVYNSRQDLINTVPLQPGIYTRVEQNMPINSNIGITCMQQHFPVKLELNECDQTYIEGKPFSQKIDVNIPNYDNVYDPRLTGYGDKDRVYIDEYMGQPRFFYDDVENMTRGNYVVKSNIDHLGFMGGSGTYQEPIKDYREMVNEAYTNATLYNRMDLQESLMRKIQDRTKQQRMAPIHTRGTAKC
jgi:hypothetical protein